MKPLKKAEQKNVSVSEFYYTENELKAIKEIDGVFQLSEEMRISLSCVKDLKIACRNGYYCTVGVMNSGEEIYVEI